MRATPPIPLTRRNMVSLGVAALFGLSVPLVLQTLPRRGRRIHPDIVRSVLADTASPSIGPASADVTVVVFSDYQCPICRVDEPVIERAIRLDPGVRFVFKDWPIFGARSEYAARVALAAARQGRFMPLHDALMRTPDPLTAASVEKIALAAGLDWPEVSRSLEDPHAGLRHQLGRHQFEAWSLGLAGTPAYLVGEDLYEGRLSQARLDEAIRTARQV